MKVLVIDSHRSESEVARQLNPHVEVEVLGEGEEALDYLRNHTVDAVFVQYQLVDMQGTKLAAYIRKNFDFPVYVVSESHCFEKWKEVTAAKAQYLPMPFDPLKILAMHQVTQPKEVPSLEVEPMDDEADEADEGEDTELYAEAQSPSISMEELVVQEESKPKQLDREKDAQPTPSAIRQPLKPKKPTHHRLQKDGGCQVVTVFSPKGGVGKTTTAVNLATYFQTELGMKTAILEFTRQTGNVLGHFDLQHTVDIKDWVQMSKMPPAEEIEDYLLWCPVTEIAILPTQKLIDEDKEKVQISVDHVDRILQALTNHFEVILIDAGTILDEVFFHILQQSHHQLMISKIERETLQDCHYMPHILERRRIGNDRLIHVLNQAKGALGIAPQDALAMVGAAMDHIIHFDKEIEKVPKEKEPYLIRAKKGKYSKEIRGLAQLVFPQHPEFEQKESWMSRLRKLR